MLLQVDSEFLPLQAPSRKPVVRAEALNSWPGRTPEPAKSIGDRAGTLPAELSIDWKTRLEGD